MTQWVCRWPGRRYAAGFGRPRYTVGGGRLGRATTPAITWDARLRVLEHMPWRSELFQERLELVDGMVPLPDRPGLGFTWDERAIRGFRSG